jgi:hemerythrin
MPVQKSSPSDDFAAADSPMMVSWSGNFATGIELIDNQHKNLFILTNELYHACRLGGDELDSVFKETMSRMVEYVRFHFATEQELLQRIKYPNYAEHKSAHDSLIKTIIETTTDYGKKRFVPNNFVRSLKDWIVSHIGHSDKLYAVYITDQKKKGLLKSKDVEG